MDWPIIFFCSHEPPLNHSTRAHSIFDPLTDPPRNKDEAPRGKDAAVDAGTMAAGNEASESSTQTDAVREKEQKDAWAGKTGAEATLVYDAVTDLLGSR